MSHPTVGVALCGTKVSDQLSSLRSEELPFIEDEKFTRIFVLGLAHTSTGRVARANFFQVFYRVRDCAPNVRGSGTSAGPLLWDGSYAWYILLQHIYIVVYRGACFMARQSLNPCRTAVPFWGQTT